MSFLVVTNGQFTPFVHSSDSATHHQVTAPSKAKEAGEFQELLNDLTPESLPKKNKQQKLDVYKKADQVFQEQKKKIYARDIMSSPVRLISPDLPAFKAREILRDSGFRHLPVVEGNNLLGMISDREITGDIEGKSCADIMINRVIVCEESAGIQEIAIILLKEKINSLPIIDHHKQIIGIITQTDVLRFVVESTSFLGRA